MAHSGLGDDLKRSPKRPLDRGQQRWCGRRSWWGTASGRPQKSILTKLCMCTLSSTTYWGLPRWWLVSASPCTLCYSPCPNTFPRRQNLAPHEGLAQPVRHDPPQHEISDKDFDSLQACTHFGPIGALERSIGSRGRLVCSGHVCCNDN